jgi:hypothetical protein
MAHITRVVIRAELSDGTVLEMHETRPSPCGDNPRYLARQLDSGVTNVAHRLEMAVTGAYGEQIPVVRVAS